MIRENYEDEVIDKTNFGLAIFFFFSFMVVSICLLVEKIVIAGIAFGMIALIDVICIFIAYFSKKRFIKKRNLIIQNGIKVDGTIIDKKINIHKRKRDNYTDTYTFTYLVIEYFYDGKKNNYITPAIAFSTNLLMDKTVDVFIYNKEIYVDNYKLKEHKNKNIFSLK